MLDGVRSPEGDGLYRPGWPGGAPGRDPGRAVPMAPAPAARGIGKARITGPYHTSSPSPAAQAEDPEHQVKQSLS